MQVWPKNDTMRKVLRHPNGVGFREDGPADWPNDSFTHRRVQDGDVLTEAPVERAAPAPKAASTKKAE